MNDVINKQLLELRERLLLAEQKTEPRGHFCCDCKHNGRPLGEWPCKLCSCLNHARTDLWNCDLEEE
jgi:hypothetical protein